MPTLTIGIPTWNRARELRECLEIATAQAALLNGEVEILISDNGSDDDTPEVISQMEATFQFVRHVSLDRNEGFDANFLNILRCAAGEYVWLLSDDDFVTEGAVAEVLRIIMTHRPCYISTNYLWYDDERKPAKEQSEERYMIRQDQPAADINTVFQVRGERLGFISCHIYRRELLDVALYECARERVCHWIHLYVTGHVIADRMCAYLSSFYTVGERRGNTRDGSSVFVKALPDAYFHAMQTFGVRGEIRDELMTAIRKHRLSPVAYLKYISLRIEVSATIVPAYYRLIPRLPMPVIRILLERKRRRGTSG